jgi:hypothetical protein
MNKNTFKKKLHRAIIRQDATAVKSILSANRKLKKSREINKSGARKNLMPHMLTSILRTLKNEQKKT